MLSLMSTVLMRRSVPIRLDQRQFATDKCHPQMLSLVPQPVKAVLLVFPLTDEIEAQRKETDKQLQENGQPDLDPTLIFIKQTVSSHTLQYIQSISSTEAHPFGRSPMHAAQSPFFTPSITSVQHTHLLTSLTPRILIDRCYNRTDQCTPEV
jgi:Ubiquitin carboxyl-terminal hydrolase, family 1